MNLIAKLEKNFHENETIEEKNNRMIKLFGIPSPDSLFVTLSAEYVKKIQHLHLLIQENNLKKIEFFIPTPSLRRGNFPPKPHEINLFLPMKDGQFISETQYIDFDDVFFDVFETQCSRVTLNKFDDKIKFQFIYFNGWTEEVFIFTYSLKDFINQI